MALQGPIDTIHSFSSYDRQMSNLSHRAELDVNISVHDARREALVKADDKFFLQLSSGHCCRSSQFEKIMTTRFPKERCLMNVLILNTFFNFYTSQLDIVNDQGCFFEQQLRRDHIEDFRGLSLHRRPQL